MRIKGAVENGNVGIQTLWNINLNNSNWINHNSNTTNNHIYNSRESNHTWNEGSETFPDDKLEIVCNEEYLRSTQQNRDLINSYTDKKTDNLDENTEVTFLGDTNVLRWHKTNAEEVQTQLSDTDEMTETGGYRVPRGLVNPNYPGFQHLAHTLQNYSSNIDNSNQSENDMTDDETDIEITEISCETDTKWDESVEKYTNINNNNINVETIRKQKHECSIQKSDVDGHIQSEIPDLLKSLSKSNKNNNSTIDFDLHCTDADIENNFHTEDIIGNFNKEVEDEIKHLLNYNINIQDDLEELRKDIKETFAKPIENTINNISEVVNHVIKKLVESNDICSQTENKFNTENINLKAEENKNVNYVKEMIVSRPRPTFLLIENKKDDMLTDAFLSDGKDEINIDENNYNTDLMSNNINNIERTMQQLSSELRKIIPKIDKMRQQDKFWEETSMRNSDLNSNKDESAGCSNSESNSKHYSNVEVGENINNSRILKEVKNHKISKKRQPSEWSDFKNGQIIPSVLQSSRNSNIGSFDVYTIETALPKLDIDAIENHLKAAKEAERRKLNDREEIRRRLAMGTDYEEYYSIRHTDRPSRKPSLHSRLQNGKNLQICFMNETASDYESQNSDVEKSLTYGKSTPSNLFSKNTFNNPYQTRPLSVSITKHDSISTIKNVSGKLRPTSLLSKTKSRSSHSLGHIELKESDFYALQATLQTEARIALAQAKEMARLQMERERRARAVSPVTEMLRCSMEKANVPLAPDRRRVSRQILTDMNIAQLQVIVNELHCKIESLNETLVNLLMQRDELHMGQDSMLVDIEDLTRYLGVKEQSKKTKGSSRTGVRRLTSLVHK